MITVSFWGRGSNGFVQRTDASGTVIPLTDAQGSVIALSDASGNLLTQYSYDPFGNTTASGASSGNEFQYIGRENDLNGLYYLHARYYSPAMGRFISEDPLGFAGDDVNLRAYTFGSPTNLRDPNGTNPLLVGCAIGAAMDVGLNLFADYYTGRKSEWTDAFSMATLGYAASGCQSGMLGGIFGELVLAPIIDMAAPYVARLFADEAGAAIKNALGDMCDLCFPAGTPVWTRKGKVPIEKIKVGDEVLSRNMQTGKLEYQKVTKLIAPHLDKLIELHIAGEAAPLRPTPSHPFYVKRAGQAEGEWIKASEIKVGDPVFTKAGKWSTVKQISPLEKSETVYNFEVEADHDYFVGSIGLLVHNFGPCFSNQLPELLEAELADAEAAGAAPMSPGSAGFSDIANSGTLNWAVTADGELVVSPSSIDGVDISHAVLVNGAPVQAAGEAEIVAAGDEMFGVSINGQSGHYMFGATAAQTAEAIAVGRAAFANFGIFFPF